MEIPVQLTDFTIGYDRKSLLSDVNTSFRSGTLTALLGRNGTGKSTLLRALAGLNSHYNGTISLFGTDMRRMSAQSLSRTLSFVSTTRQRIAAMRCRDIVALGRAPYTNWSGNLTAADRRIVDDALQATGMSAFADRDINSLSDGECQRIMVARALAQETPIMLLDEPTGFLDLPNRYELGRLLARLAHDRGKCVVFSTHELEIAMKTADNLAVIEPPHLHNSSTADIISSGLVSRLFAL